MHAQRVGSVAFWRCDNHWERVVHIGVLTQDSNGMPPYLYNIYKYKMCALCIIEMYNNISLNFMMRYFMHMHVYIYVILS